MPKTKRTSKEPLKAFKQLTERRILKYLERLVFVAAGTQGNPAFPLFIGPKPSQAIADKVLKAAFTKRTPKTVFATKCCRSEQGLEYIAEPIEFGLGKCLLADAYTDEEGTTYDSIADWITEQLSTITHNSKHYICDAYIVLHGDTELPEAKAVALLDKINAFDGLANWEIDNEKN